MAIRKVVPIELAEWRIEPAPEWVSAQEPDWEYMAHQEYSAPFLLIDEQHQVPTRSMYHRTVRRLLTHSAVQSLSQAEFEFDPAAYRLIVHELAVWRKGSNGVRVRRSCAIRENFLLRQREQQLEQQMLHGRVSVVALLEDIRVDDIIDRAWTLEPRDQMPGTQFTAMQTFAWTVPVSRMVFTLHLSPEHPVQWRMHARANIVAPVEDIRPERASWSVDRPALFEPEPNVPEGHWEFPFLEVSGWQTWAEVATFAADLWTDALADAADALNEEAQRLNSGRDPSAAARAAIQFVQEEVRYLAVDFGHGGGLLPNGSGVILRRRFGDCKDKSVLLTALLRTLGIEAYPLLVSTGWREALDRVQPSTAAFNHVIVTFCIDGRRHFVDPTVLGQGGDFEHLVAPPYGRGLEIRHGAADLLILPDVPAAELVFEETFTLDRHQRAGGVLQELRATSWLADEMRSALLRQGRTAFFKGRVEVLQEAFPALVPGADASAMEVIDDAALNIITLRTHYGLPTWGPLGQKPPRMFTYGARGLSLAVDFVEGPEKRKQPWALRFPMVVRNRVIVRGKNVQRTKRERYAFAGPGFEYTCDVVPSKRREVTFEYTWTTTAREVAPDKWAEYCRQREQAFTKTGANVVARLSTEEVIKNALGITAGIFCALFVCTIFALSLMDKGVKRATHQENEAMRLDTMKRVYASAQQSVARGDFATAEPAIERLQSDFGRDFDYQMLRAKVALGLGKIDRARSAIISASVLRPNDPELDRLRASVAEKARGSAGMPQ